MTIAREVTVTTPLAPEALLLRRMTAMEGLGRPFEFNLELTSPDEGLAFEDILGQVMTVKLETDDFTRHFSGHVTEFRLIGRSQDQVEYAATLRPWLWFLTRTADCRIFQDMPAIDIISEIFRDHGFSDFEVETSGTYRNWEYCVQYRETAFNFVSRLMEQEGIYYYFRHEDGKHTLVLADSPQAHGSVSGFEELPFHRTAGGSAPDYAYVSEWLLSKRIQPGSYALDDYDFTKPSASLDACSVAPKGHARGDFEVYDYPGEYLENSEGDIYARIRIEEMQSGYERISGASNAPGLTVGSTFELVDHPRADQNREYLIVSATSSIVAAGQSSGNSGGSEEPTWITSFETMDAGTQFRSLRSTPKPVVQGPQTAVVVGAAGEEIWTDEYGRVKVQFHWDRRGSSDENSSCWIRVSHPWAGKGWGAISTPRMGQEVIVEFLEGDPDRPIITGRVYNASNMPPYPLPDDKTQSGLKTRSSLGGTADNCNEIRFEDKMGEEQLLVHAEKDMEESVENDQAVSVGHDQSISVENDREKTVGANETNHIKANRTETVDANEEITISGNRQETVMGTEDLTLLGDRTETLAANETLTIAGSKTDMIVGSLTQTVVGGITITSPAAISITAVGGYTVVAPAGTTTLDSFFNNVAAQAKDMYGLQLAIVGQKTDIAGLAISMIGTKIDTAGVAIAVNGVEQTTNGCELKTALTSIKSGALKLWNSGISIFS